MLQNSLMKRQRTKIHEPNATYFLTSTISGFTKIFQHPEPAQILLDNLKFYKEKFSIKIHAYVIMPNHFHLLLTMGKKGTVSQFMGQLKEYSAKEILKWCEKGKRTDLLQIFRASAEKYKPKHQFQVWQERFDDLKIDDADTFLRKMEYIHHNPLQEHWSLASSPEKYAHSSACFYVLGEKSGIDIGLSFKWSPVGRRLTQKYITNFLQLPGNLLSEHVGVHRTDHL